MTATAADTAAAGARRALADRLHGLRSALQALFAERRALAGRRRQAAQRRLLLGLELLAKLEEQTLAPALRDAEPGWSVELDLAQQELEVMRDVSALVQQTAAGQRDAVLAVLEGLHGVHAARADALLRRPGAQAVPWPRLQREVQALLQRWHDEVATHGEIEDDEEQDPVGLPPR